MPGQSATSGSFVKGDPRAGRPPGLKNKQTHKQREIAEMVLGKLGTPEFDAFIAGERKALLDGTMHPATKQLWMHYGFGKPVERVDVQGEVTVEKIVREVIRVPDESQFEEAVH